MATGKLKDDVVFTKKATVCKYIVPEGYGVNPISGHEIAVDVDAVHNCGAEIYFANVDVNDCGKLVTGTSRSIGIVGVGDTLEIAEHNCEAALQYVKCDAMFVRHDIGTKELIQRRIDHMKQIRP